MNKRDEMAHKLFIEDCYDPGEYQGFLKGWDASLKHAPEVLALIEALEWVYKIGQTRDEDGEPMINIQGARADEALAIFCASQKGSGE